jgi:hypothetical protein
MPPSAGEMTRVYRIVFGLRLPAASGLSIAKDETFGAFSF